MLKSWTSTRSDRFPEKKGGLEGLFELTFPNAVIFMERWVLINRDLWERSLCIAHIFEVLTKWPGGQNERIREDLDPMQGQPLEVARILSRLALTSHQQTV